MNKKAVLTLKIVTAFSAAAVVAGTMTYSYRTADKKKLENNDGLGGLEISAVPQYDTQEKIENSVSENVSDAEFIETDSVQDRKDLLALEEAEKKLIDGGLYYSSYRIKKGDMIGVIAEKYGISQDTLISVNKIRATRTIQIGQNIKIPSLDGILYTVKKDGETPETIAEKYEVSADEVANVNKIAVNASLDAGQSVFVPGAELDWITRQEINGDLFRKPIRSYYRITSYFGWRGSPFTGRRQFHGGIDMACSTGTPIYAAMEGVISYRGYSNVYGNYVIVTHHSGYKTLYGHMSRFSKLTVGNRVTTGSVIGYVGSTGQSTGSHCHFTVFKNGRMVDPYNLWG
ncbi:MAG: M23 family metallopeptidase [Spirochaetia bacterium]|nr:M23 family metallopeptidase [Spirochaetia bacterium]MDD7699081.1 peptidoglycan DD-metalloendopeptidase family protein [Spirochaetia bacterium]